MTAPPQEVGGLPRGILDDVHQTFRPSLSILWAHVATFPAPSP